MCLTLGVILYIILLYLIYYTIIQYTIIYYYTIHIRYYILYYTLLSLFLSLYLSSVLPSQSTLPPFPSSLLPLPATPFMSLHTILAPLPCPPCTLPESSRCVTGYFAGRRAALPLPLCASFHSSLLLYLCLDLSYFAYHPPSSTPSVQ